MSAGDDLRARHVHTMALWSMEQLAVLSELKLLIQAHHGSHALILMEATAEAAALEAGNAVS